MHIVGSEEERQQSKQTDRQTDGNESHVGGLLGFSIWQVSAILEGTVVTQETAGGLGSILAWRPYQAYQNLLYWETRHWVSVTLMQI
jgi:hypothetical protein